MITLLAEVAITPGFYFRYGPIGVALGVLIPLAVLYAIFLYRRHSELSPKLRIGLGILRAIVYGVIILLLFAPVINETKKISIPSNILVLLDVSESMSIEDRRSRPGELADAAAALGKIPIKDLAQESVSELPVDLQSEVGKVSRLDLAKGILGLPELAILRESTDATHVSSYTFGEKLTSSSDDPNDDTP